MTKYNDADNTPHQFDFGGPDTCRKCGNDQNHIVHLRKYSAEWIKQQAIERRATWLPHHDCSICHVDVGYVIINAEVDDVYFRSSCNCGGWSNPRPTSFTAIASFLAMQQTDEIRDRIMERLQ